MSRSHPEMTADEVIARLGLEPLSGEGGYYRQTWSSSGGEGCPDPIGTAIYYLVTPDSWSALHRLTLDEVFHVYLGDPCEMVMLSDAGEMVHIRLGSDIVNGETVQHVVPAGWWQGTRLAQGGSWALLGTTMAPGFRPDVFELASDAVLDTVGEDIRRRLVPFLP
jgi:predicted cupin superfamily sugar epimerase